MADDGDAKKDRIDRFIDQNLKRVFSDLESDEMPDQIIDLLAVLRAQDTEMKDKNE